MGNVMDIGTLQSSTQSSTTQVSPPVPQPVNDEIDNETEETALSTDSTLALSDAAQTLATSTVIKTNDTAEIDNENKARLSVQQFQKDADNDPSLTELAQSNNATSKAVESLIA